MSSSNPHVSALVLNICSAYESGFGHGLDNTAASNPYSLADTDCFGAWQYGHEQGTQRRSRVETKADPTGNWPLKVFSPLPPEEAQALRDYGEGYPDDEPETKAERELAGHIVDLYNAQEAEDWQAIETAPKNGETVLLYREMGTWMVRGYGHWEDCGDGVCGWITNGFFDPPGNLGLANPTHWRPIPKSPPLVSATTELPVKSNEKLSVPAAPPLASLEPASSTDSAAGADSMSINRAPQ